jgi:hypothetical protein
MKNYKLGKRRSYPWVFAALSIAAFSLFLLAPDNLQNSQVLFSVLGTLAAFVHFLYSQHNVDTERFIRLFNEFNLRYDKLNAQMNRIFQLPSPVVFTQGDRSVLFDYFNLCSEEYLYYKSGFLDQDVWEAWVRGMQYFAGKTEIGELWLVELNQDSYYGFPTTILTSSTSKST